MYFQDFSRHKEATPQKPERMYLNLLSMQITLCNFEYAQSATVHFTHQSSKTFTLCYIWDKYPRFGALKLC